LKTQKIEKTRKQQKQGENRTKSATPAQEKKEIGETTEKSSQGDQQWLDLPRIPNRS